MTYVRPLGGNSLHGMTDGGRGRGWWARPVGLVAIGVVIALAIGGTVWAVTSSSGWNNATPTQPTKPQGSVNSTTTVPPGASSTAPGVVTPTTPTTGDTVSVPDVVTGTVVSSAEQILQGRPPAVHGRRPTGQRLHPAVRGLQPECRPVADAISRQSGRSGLTGHLGSVLTRLPWRAALQGCLTRLHCRAAQKGCVEDRPVLLGWTGAV
jgi:hypothetical protein